jgi:hypothetical protein
MKRYTFVVTGKGPFPTDMLRYDGCYPRDQASVNEMTYADAGIPGNYHTPHTVALSMPVEAKHQVPTEARWLSFGWRVHDVQFHRS